MRAHRASVDTRRLVGGAVSLDLANSIDWATDGTERPSHTEALIEPAALATWGRRADVVAANAVLPVSMRELSRARALRRALHDVFAAVAAQRAPDARALALLKNTYLEAITAADLRQSDGAWTFDWEAEDSRRVRFAAAVDAVELLRDAPKLARLRMCPGNDCGWLFLDTSGRRRWCSMEVCGSRAKMRRRYQLQRERAPRRDPPRI
jgi:predicted RNA-binding Zn ribbon-like protein